VASWASSFPSLIVNLGAGDDTTTMFADLKKKKKKKKAVLPEVELVA
jgi:hypothetical protein